LLAVKQKKLTLDQVKLLLHDKPQQIFNIPQTENTYIEFDPEKPYLVGETGYQTKCGWSPFHNWTLYGKVETVMIQNRPVVRDGQIV
jgi:dihydroorotase